MCSGSSQSRFMSCAQKQAWCACVYLFDTSRQLFGCHWKEQGLPGRGICSRKKGCLRRIWVGSRKIDRLGVQGSTDVGLVHGPTTLL